MSDRKKHISVLKNMLKWMEAASKVASKEERKEAVKYAISSLETDEAYQLMEEQPEFCEDCISREYIGGCINKDAHYTGEEILSLLETMPSVLPKADKPTIIDWNNCHTPEQLESIATTKNNLAVDKTDMIDKSNFSQEQYKTDLQSAYDSGYEQAKNDLGVDYISRTSALDCINWAYNLSDAYQKINELPSVTPQEPQTFKWCKDCREYDQENHCCHRWSKVIRDTVEEMKQEPKSEWEQDRAILKAYSDGANEVLDKIDEIITDALDKSTDQKESQTLRWVLDKISEVT